MDEGQVTGEVKVAYGEHNLVIEEKLRVLGQEVQAKKMKAKIKIMFMETSGIGG